MSLSCLACDAQELNDEFQFCPFCGARLPHAVICPECGHESEPDTNFCPKCGTALKQAPSPKRKKAAKPKAQVVEIPPAPEEGITIEFLYSTSGAFEFAVDAAQQHPSFQQYGEGKKAVYRVTVPRKELAEIMPIVEYIKGWRRKAIYVDGEKILWTSAFTFTWCFERRQESFRPEYYCFGYEDLHRVNPWGCLMADLPFSEHARWCTWGKWLNKRGDWEFDKDRIRHELQTKLYAVRLCPALDLTLAEQAFAAFPARVNPKTDKEWTFVETWDDSVPGLVVTTTQYGFEERTTMIGAAPKGMGALQRIVKAVYGVQLPKIVD
jgi:hypothetical protein